MTGTDPEALANLFPVAAAYVANHWAPGRLEARSKSPRSSQALCVSLLVTINQRPPDHRAATISAICAEAGLVPLDGIPDIDAEVRKHGALLGELGGGTPTALDGLITTPHAVLAVESKFTEPEFGSCGQIKPQKVKPPDPRFAPEAPNMRYANCTGMHAVGSDQKWTTQYANVPCRLTVPAGKRKPRRYWEVAPELFLPEVLRTAQPCPFATDAYQLMRNLAFSHEWARTLGLAWYGLLVMLVDASAHAPELRRRVGAFKALLKPEVRGRVGIVSCERIAELLLAHGEPELGEWVRNRIALGPW